MSPWDRQAVIRRYERKFDESDDPNKLVDMLGTATKVAVMLADGYISSPPPEEAESPEPEIETFDAEEQMSFEALAEETAEAEEAEPTELEPELPSAPQRGGVRPGALIGFIVFTLLIGIPVAVLLFCVGVPFLASGAGVIGAAARTVLDTLSGLNLFSDVLLLCGGALILAAVGLLLAWLGLWIGISLVRLWIARVILPMGRRISKGRKADAA